MHVMHTATHAHSDTLVWFGLWCRVVSEWVDYHFHTCSGKVEGRFALISSSTLFRLCLGSAGDPFCIFLFLICPLYHFYCLCFCLPQFYSLNIYFFIQSLFIIKCRVFFILQYMVSSTFSSFTLVLWYKLVVYNSEFEDVYLFLQQAAEVHWEQRHWSHAQWVASGLNLSKNAVAGVSF